MCWHRYVRAIPVAPVCFNCGRTREAEPVLDLSELFEDLSAIF